MHFTETDTDQPFIFLFIYFTKISHAHLWRNIKFIFYLVDLICFNTGVKKYESLIFVSNMYLLIGESDALLNINIQAGIYSFIKGKQQF